MARWFDEKFERDRIRKYTKDRLKSGTVGGFARKLTITSWLIIFNSVIFLLVFLMASIFGEEKVFGIVAIQPNLFFSGYVWTAFTSMFIHGSFGHLLANMFSLFFIGNFVEKLIGRKRFLWFYLISGIFAGIFYAFLSYYLGSICILNIFGGCLGEKIFVNPSVFAVGASGAIFALLGLLAVLTPKNKVFLIAGPLIGIIVYYVLKAAMPNLSNIFYFILAVYIFISLFSMISFNPKLFKISLPLEMTFWLLPIIAIAPLVIIGLFLPLPIGNTAHLGGLIAGIFYGIYLKKRYRRKTEMISKIFSR